MTTRHAGRPETRFVETARGAIAYQVFGEGERDLLFISHWLTNVDAYWDEPSAVRFFDRLSAMGRVIIFDKLGSGVSDMTPSGLVEPVELYVDQTRAVLEAAGSEKATLIGDTEGGMLACVMAAQYPETFPELILINTYPRLRRADDYPIGAPDHVVERLSELWRVQHGTSGNALFVTAPSTANDKRFLQWWIKFQRSAQKPRIAKDAVNWIANTDIRSVLSTIQARTLVIHKRDAQYHRLQYGEYLAEKIPGANLEVVDGADTIPFHSEFGQTLDLVEEFLTGQREVAPSNRMLSTVLFTDIVGSTALAAQLGDERWLDLRADHDRMVRENLGRFRGVEVAMTGDGAVATFDGPQRAIMSAITLKEDLETIGVPIRAGIHTGEIEVRDGDVGGIGVHIASRVMGAAENGGIMVSSTVKDLVVGSEVQFGDCGAHELKGVPGTWNLYEVLEDSV